MMVLYWSECHVTQLGWGEGNCFCCIANCEHRLLFCFANAIIMLQNYHVYIFDFNILKKKTKPLILTLTM